MEKFDIIHEFKVLATKLKEDDRLVYLKQARNMNDMDQELQALISKFNLAQYNYQIEITKDDMDEAKVTELNDELQETYSQIMENDSMQEYNACKAEVDTLVLYLQNIIAVAVNDGDPMLVPEPVDCNGVCAGCSGCGN